MNTKKFVNDNFSDEEWILNDVRCELREYGNGICVTVATDDDECAKDFDWTYEHATIIVRPQYCIIYQDDFMASRFNNFTIRVL